MLLLTVDPQGGRDVGPAAKVCVLKGKKCSARVRYCFKPDEFRVCAIRRGLIISFTFTSAL